MLNRRGFLGAGMASCALPWLASVAGPSAQAVPSGQPGAWARPSPPLYRVVVDERFEAGAGFRAGVAARGAEVRGIRGDVTELWFYELAPRWREQAAPIAGLTAADALFCLERLAWDAGLRVAYRGEHRRLANGTLRHRMSGSASALAPAASLASAQFDWDSRVAELVLACPRRSPSRLMTISVTSPCASPASAGPLYSWVIAANATRAASLRRGALA
jgi:hypothetical protein